MKVVIIEDEPLTADDLADTLVHVDKSIEVEAVLPSVKKAISYFNENEFPDLIFSDIQLGDGLSFEIFKAVQTSTPVVFCTAFDEYALEAFKANGIEYVLKPFTTASIQHTVQKYKQLQKSLSKPDTSYKQIYDLLESKIAQKRSSILVYQRDKIIPLPVAEIAVCYVESQLTRALCFDQRSFVVSHTLDELEATLGTQFFRANRQHLVNHKAVKEASQYFGRKLYIALTIPFQEDMIVSKAKSPVFLDWLASQ
ncbi:LytR/AlgR family response regulator transcription factor [Pontibacter harenae]|uniref:LytR/AlgR family response regulator transcription factor n=1 Tax=Pontibacter harenae TaxID=2894083 RepID=UPI001E316B0F|nr:LytTR family DNA-binding domain-containing protein [Pontibacter harenae]MCC9166648.1 LytTR family DNA-binding domain-containing protein [Pontibacter harenae]